MSNTDSSSVFDTQKQTILNNISQSNEIIELILNNQNLDIASAEQINKLRQILAKNKIFQHKLNSNEFEVAIVGLEKAGKSTFANALIGNNILPSAPERCTFTSTRLVSGADKATVQFYTEAEFEHIFQEMLKEIDYPSAEKVSYKTLTQEAFESYFHQLEQNNPSLYKNHVGKTNEEIIDIIKCRSKLRLDGQTITFQGEQLTQDEFQEYIKGRKNDTSKPRSVKSIEIESSQLQQMRNVIMYDVPGFDSPTQLHIRQTEERLKKADAIILVTNAGTNPSIQGTSLNVIRNNSDEDGIALKDKLFVFGNQIDRVNTQEQLSGNEAILRADVRKYNIGEDKRVFVGSALMYLDKNHTSKFKDLRDNIEPMRQALTAYYQSERFEILKKKIHSNERELKTILDDIVNKQTSHGDITIDENRLKAEISQKESKAIEKRLQVQLKDFFAQLKADILSEKWISKRMEEEISDERYFAHIDETHFQRVQRLTDDSLRTNVQFEKVNFEIRKGLHLKYLEEYLSIIKNVTSEKCKMVEDDLQQVFSKAVCGTAPMSYEIEQECQRLIHQITHEVSHDSERFHYLIERFSRDLFDIMLNSPVGSNDRLSRYEKSRPDIQHLDHYYSKGQGELISMALSQKKHNLIAWLKGMYVIGNIDSKKSIEIAGKLATIWGLKTSAIFEFLQGIKPKISIPDDIDVHQLVKIFSISSAQSEQAVVEEINQDLTNLRQALVRAVVPAIDLEVAFLNGVDKQIKLLLSALNQDNDYKQVFSEFLSRVVVLVKKPELDNVSQIIEQQKLKKALIDKIAQLHA